MLKYIITCAVIVGLNTYGYAELADNINSESKRETPETVNGLTNAYKQQTKEERISSQDIQLKDYIVLEKGMFGLPFTGINDVLIWCNQNELQIANPSETMIDGQLKEIAETATFISDGMKNDVLHIRQALIEIEANSILLDNANQEKVSQMKELVGVKKYPSVVYKNAKYFLEPVFAYKKSKSSKISYGIPFVVKSGVSGSNTIYCDSKEAMNSYILTAMPNEEMQKNGIRKIKIFLLKNKEDKFKSYAAVVMVVGEKYNELAIFLNVENGMPAFFHSNGGDSETTYDIVGVGLAPAEKLYWDIFYLTGERVNKFTMWGRNIISDSVNFNFIFYEPNLGKAIIEERFKALQECKKKVMQAPNDNLLDLAGSDNE